MASRSKQRTTMAKHNRERAVKEKREEKEIRKAARKLAAAIEREGGAAPEELGAPEQQPDAARS